MSNNLGIPERTLAQLADSTDSINTIAATAGHRKTWDRSIVVRVTDHVSDTAAEEDDPEKMAIFESVAIGHPWKRKGNHLASPLWKTTDPATDVIPKNVELLYPDFDYTTFE